MPIDILAGVDLADGSVADSINHCLEVGVVKAARSSERKARKT